MKMISVLLGVLFLGAVRTDAAPITWHWAGPVDGYSCIGGGGSSCTELGTVVPLGTPVDVFVTIDPDAPTYPAPAIPCLWGFAGVSMSVIGQTFTGTAHVWVDGHGFGPGTCHPGINSVELVAPSWGVGNPALPGDWGVFTTFGAPLSYMPGLYWGVDNLTDVPNALFVGSQLPAFYKGPGSDDPTYPQRFTVDLAPVPEPSTLLLLGTGLVAAWRRRS